MHATLFCAPLSLSLHTSKSLIHKYTYIFRLIVSLLLLLRQINKLLACSRNLAQCFWKWRGKFYRKRKISNGFAHCEWNEFTHMILNGLKLKWSQRSNLSNYILREKRDREKKWNVSSLSMFSLRAYSYYYSYYYYC